jgi:hypothetical protein
MNILGMKVSKIEPANLFSYRKSQNIEWINNFNNSPSRIDPKMLKNLKDYTLERHLKKDLRNSHFKLGTQISQFQSLKTPNNDQRSSTAMGFRRGSFFAGFAKAKDILPKQGVHLGMNKTDHQTSNQMFFQWIQPKPVNL